MIVSLLGYFFYVVTAFTAAMVLLTSFDNSRLTSHNPHPVIASAATATQKEDERISSIAVGQSAKYGTENDTKTYNAAAKDSKQSKNSRVVVVAKAGHKKNERTRLAHLDASKVLARFGPARGSSEPHGFRMALGYAEGSGYRPGLDSQR